MKPLLASKACWGVVRGSGPPGPVHEQPQRSQIVIYKTTTKESDREAAPKRSPQFRRKCVTLDNHRTGETCESWVEQNFGNCRAHTKVLLADAIRLNTRLWREQKRYGVTHPTAGPDWPTYFKEPIFRSEAFIIALSVRAVRLAFKARAYYWLGFHLRSIWYYQYRALGRDNDTVEDGNAISGGGSGDGDEDGDAEHPYDTSWLHRPD